MTRQIESLDDIADLSDRQVRNRTLYQIGLATFALEQIALSVGRVADAIEAMTAPDDLDTVELIRDDD